MIKQFMYSLKKVTLKMSSIELLKSQTDLRIKIRELVKASMDHTSRQQRQRIFPVADSTIHTYALHLQNSHWSANEINFEGDIPHYRRMNERDKKILMIPQAYFSSADSTVISGVERFGMEATDPSEKFYFNRVYDNESTHVEGYQLTGITFEPDRFEEFQLQSVSHPGVRGLNDWIDDNVVLSEAPKWERHFCAALSEMATFMPMFVPIFYVARRPNRDYNIDSIATLNSFVARDETIHGKGHIHLTFKHAARDGDRVDENRCVEIVKDLVEAMKIFNDSAFSDGVESPDFNRKLLNQYSENTVDKVMGYCGFNKIYKTENPFPFMSLIGLNEKDNMYEVATSTNYSKFSITSALEKWGLATKTNDALQSIICDVNDVDF